MAIPKDEARSARAVGGSPLAPKDEAHPRSARARWGPARTVRLDDLNPDERTAVLTLVRLFGAKREPGTLSETCVPGSVEVRRASDTTP